MRVGASGAKLIELNFGKNPRSCDNCSNLGPYPRSCDDGPYPQCLTIGQVLTVPVAPVCTARPGVWECNSTIPSLAPYSCIGELLEKRSDGQSEAAWKVFFCKANRRAFPGCSDPSTWPDVCTANQTVKIPTPICIPNDKSYCSGTFSTVDNDIYHNNVSQNYHYVYCSDLGGQSTWDGNELVIDQWGNCFGFEYHIPRGSLDYAGPPPLPPPPPVKCTPVPGEHICHKPLPPVPPSNGSIWWCAAPGSHSKVPPDCLWEDSVYQIAQQFGVDWKDLCAFNKMENCSVLEFSGNALKIPVRKA
jgi:hypothetical protein